ncbi:bis(5'-nucleosyl)-tetraphosphatase [asymmetrical] [Planococcus citri]|uniref:bis(5'-nucleosyl)-tetraphosphatase [asymmetrical] n=1 Tax=Planococcus citri TaxID=170843 RepID=UPI0031F85D44
MVVRAAGYVIFRKCADIEFLLLQASYGDFHWSPPKGHVDPGENEPETALREVEEETGLKKSDLRIISGFEKVLTYKVKQKPKAVVYWMAELINPNQEVKISHEHKDFKWLPLKEACDIAKYPESIDLLKASHDFLSSSS